ncbi:gamma-glutamyl-gamma-aminobutyrate hydrolase family protein [Methylacidimicrobium sp. B4]|uniref:gamma-glutamyl-gamma-aminobutyrate hydrolase family protein n=1 Tax=Methylacidimicrobium sp. B4 TaxID=2796139 RepID=UPI001A8EAD74|nr:gamma-glutamyl-gamma-aminobutyrate hydrolase family protein [Methylacidimicrobium sp. B4]QSR84769.1 gamma-glutamyl-gamma-aminobutyrate hydrolase family protein [Methylacidimicrobium sp. B4]
MWTIASWIRAKDEPIFARIFEPEGFLLRNARAEEVPCEGWQGLLLTGGADISAPFLGQEIDAPEKIRSPNPKRDEWEFAALRSALERQLPVLTICRGTQLLNVALGGSLHLDVPGHENLEDAHVQPLAHAEGVEFQFPLVNSSHHQALDRLGTGVVPEAWCVLDGIVEQVRVDGYRFVRGVQYHPERDPVRYRPLFAGFFAAVRQAA